MTKCAKRSRKWFVIRRWTALILITLIIFISVDYNIRPLVKSIVENKAQVEATNVINQVVEDEFSSNSDMYSELMSIQRGENGEVQSISTNTVNTNMFVSFILINNFP